MALKGQITFDDLRRASDSGWKPDVRIFVQEITKEGLGGSVLRELKGWSSVSIDRRLGARGSATISFGNPHDRVFNHGFVPPQTTDKSSRGVFSGIVDLINPQIDADIFGYMGATLAQALPFIKEINPSRRFRGDNNAFIRRGFQGLSSFSEVDVNKYLSFLFNYDGWYSETQFDGVSGPGQSVPDNPLVQRDLIQLGLMQRVFIDIKGQNGEIFAGFTGILSAIRDNYIAGEMPTVELVCYDYWRLLELTDIIVQEGPGRQQIDNSIMFEVQRAQGLQNISFMSTQFQGMEGTDIVERLLRLINSIFCWVPFLLESRDAKEKSPLDALDIRSSGATQFSDFADVGTNGVKRSDFWNAHGFWQFHESSIGQIVPKYQGLNTLRRHQASFEIVQPKSDNNGDPIFQELTPDQLLVLSGTDKAAQDLAKIVGLDDVQRNAFVRQFLKGESSRYQMFQGRVAREAQNDKDSLTRGIEDGDLMAMYQGSFHVDANILDGKQGEVYRLAIAHIMGPWQVQRQTAAAIMKRVMDATFYDVFFNGNGDCVYQIPRYNNFPGEFSPEFPGIASSGNQNVYTATQVTDLSKKAGLGQFVGPPFVDPSAPIGAIDPSAVATVNNTTAIVRSTEAGKYNFDLPGNYDFVPPRYFATRDHGFNWVITDVGLRSWQLQSSEEALVTALWMPNQPDWLPDLNKSIQVQSQTGKTTIEHTDFLQRRFGVRFRETQMMFLKQFFSGAKNIQKILDAFADALLWQINGAAYGGTIGLTSRPDLDVGNNIFLVERQRLLYVTGWDYRYTQGNEASTSLKLSYGHNFRTLIPNPWIEISLSADQIRRAGEEESPTTSEATGQQFANKPARQSTHTTADSDTGLKWRFTRYAIANEAFAAYKGNRVTPLFDLSGNVIKLTHPKFYLQSRLNGTGRLDSSNPVDYIHFSTNNHSVSPTDPGIPQLFQQFLTQAQSDIEKATKSGSSLITARKNAASQYGLILNDPATGIISVDVFQRTSSILVAAPSIPAKPYKTMAADIGTAMRHEPFYRNNKGLVPLGTKVTIAELKGQMLPDETGRLVEHDGTVIVNDTGSKIFGRHFDLFVGIEDNVNKFKIPSIMHITFEGDVTRTNLPSHYTMTSQLAPLGGDRYTYGLKG